MMGKKAKKKKQLFNIIIPFFTKHSINNEKSPDFYNFNLAVTILYNNLGKGFHNLSYVLFFIITES
jgi:hypothetical protein